MTTLDWTQWLRQAGYGVLLEPNEQSLASLLGTFRKAVPFENLDVLIGCAPSTDVQTIARKVFETKRGGWCFETNLLLADLLRATGFDVKFRLARVGYHRQSLGPLTHLVLSVRLKGVDWLVDAGFGGPGPLEPLRLETGEQEDRWGCKWRLDVSEADGTMLGRWMDDHWQGIYGVSSLTVLPVDLDVASFFLSHWPMSPFKRMLIAVAFDGCSHWCLEDLALVQRDARWVQLGRTPLRDATDLAFVLGHRFGVIASPEICRAAWSRLSQAVPGT